VEERGIRLRLGVDFRGTHPRPRPFFAGGSGGRGWGGGCLWAREGLSERSERAEREGREKEEGVEERGIRLRLGVGSGVPSTPKANCCGCVGGGVIVGIIKEGFKEVAVAEWVGVSGCGSILIETLRRANGDLERIDILLVHFVWKRANVEKVALERNERTFLFPDWKANWAI